MFGVSAFVGFLFTGKVLITGVCSDDLHATSPDVWDGKRRLGLGFTSAFDRLPKNMIKETDSSNERGWNSLVQAILIWTY